MIGILYSAVGKDGVDCEEGAVQTSESLKTIKPSAESRVNSSEEYKPKIVGIYMPPSVEYIIAVLSVLRCGEAFLPLDPFWPNERILSVASSSNADLIIGSESSFGNSNLDRLDESRWLVKSISCPVLSYSIEENLQECSCSTDLPWPCANEKKRSFCYLMYTSGSSGKPKGVCGTEQGNLLLYFFCTFSCYIGP
jgi:acyl-CoA synthetase